MTTTTAADRMQAGTMTVEPAVIDGRSVFIVREHGYIVAQVGSVEELADIVPLEQLASKTAARADSIYGKNDIDALFPDGAIITMVPWQQAYRTKNGMYDKEVLRKALSDPNWGDHMAEFDPRDLRATQPSITRQGVSYYLSDAYRQSGVTFADQGNPGNRTPVVYIRPDGTKILLSGHHRAAVALLRGEPLHALRVEESSAKHGVGHPVAVRGRAPEPVADGEGDDGRRGPGGDRPGWHRRAAARAVAGGRAGARALRGGRDDADGTDSLAAVDRRAMGYAYSGGSDDQDRPGAHQGAAEARREGARRAHGGPAGRDTEWRPLRVIHDPRGLSGTARSVTRSRRFDADLAAAPGNIRNLVQDYLDDLRLGTPVDLRIKGRDLAGSFTINVVEDGRPTPWRIGLYITSYDDSWVAYWLGEHNYDEAEKRLGSLTRREMEGRVGDRSHITCIETGTVPTEAIADLMGVKGEVPGEHRNKQGQVWEDFKSDIRANGIQEPIFITVDYGEQPKISEGNHRRDVAVEEGMPEVPVEIRYFGHAERTTKVASADDWLPDKGMWTRGQEILDPRIFVGEQMKPEVRATVLGLLDRFWTPRYGEWRKWAKVYLAGSGASHWWDSDGDLDILIGIDMHSLIQARPQNAGVSEADVCAHLDKELKADLDPTTSAYDFGPPKPMEVTFFVNPGSYDIARIHPYAAYDITDDGWVVKPPVLPGDWSADSMPPWMIEHCRLIADEVRDILARPEPQRTEQGVAMFNRLHEWRQQAYAEGNGWLSFGNVVYQWLSQEGLLRQLYLLKHPEEAASKEAGKGPSTEDPTDVAHDNEAVYLQAAAPEGSDLVRQFAVTPASTDFFAGEADDLSRAYRDMPLIDPAVAPLWVELAEICRAQAASLRATFQIVVHDDLDPYETAEQMHADIDRGIYQVTSLHSHHPVWTPQDNVAFRIVHDILGHGVAGSDFSFKGEVEAYQAQCKVTPVHLWPVLFTEVIAQSAYANTHHLFGEQKVGLVPLTQAQIDAEVGKVMDGPDAAYDALHYSATKTASTYTVFVGWGARTPDDPVRALSPDSHGRIVVVEADSDTEAHMLAAQMVNSGGTNPITSLLPDGMPTSTKILSMEAKTAPATEIGKAYKTRLGRCYELTATRMMDHFMASRQGVNDYILVHGSIQGDGEPRISHCWVIEPDGIWEPATNTTYDPVAFQRLFNAKEEHRFTWDQTRKHMLDVGTYGPWLPMKQAKTAAEWREEDHPRGRPDNAGQFRRKNSPAPLPRPPQGVKPIDNPPTREAMEARGDVFGHYLPKGKYAEGDPRNEPEFERIEHEKSVLTDRYVGATREGIEQARDKGASPAEIARMERLYFQAKHDRERGIGGSTDELYDRIPDPKTRANPYIKSRRRLHEKILSRFARQAAKVPHDSKCLIMAGPSGAGKSTFLENNADKFGITMGPNHKPTNYVVINPDDLKDFLPVDLSRYPDLNKNEVAGIVHEESSYLAKRLVRRLMGKGVNVILDVTLANADKAYKQYVKPFPDYDHTTVLVDGDVRNSLNNAGIRYKALDKTTGERTYSGRFVPMSLVEKQAPRPGTNYRSSNAEQFHKFSAMPGVEHAYVYDPLAAEPTLTPVHDRHAA